MGASDNDYEMLLGLFETDTEDGEILLWLERTARTAGRWAEYNEYLEDLNLAQPNNATVSHRLAMRRLEDAEAAEEDPSILTTPIFIDAVRVRAEESVRQFCILKPGSAESSFLLGRLYVFQNEREHAAEIMREMELIDKKRAAILRGLAARKWPEFSHI